MVERISRDPKQIRRRGWENLSDNGRRTEMTIPVSRTKVPLQGNRNQRQWGRFKGQSPIEQNLALAALAEVHRGL